MGVLLSFVGLGSVTAGGMATLWRAVLATREEVLADIKTTATVELTRQALSDAAWRYQETDGVEERQAFERSLANFSAALRDFEAISPSLADDAARAAATTRQGEAAEALARDILDRGPTRRVRLDALIETLGRMERGLTVLRDSHMVELDRELERAGRAVSRTVLSAAGAVLLSVLVAVAIALWLSSWVTRPLRSLAAASRAITAGDRSPRVPVEAGGELGAVARHFNEMAEQIEVFERKQTDRLRDLEAALAHVRRLRGLLPICSYCKRVREDGNYRQQLETYVAEHSEAEFSHGICPECYDAIVRPELEARRGRLLRADESTG